MSFKDKSIQCLDCGAMFTFSAQDQEFYQSKGFINEPKRCPSCRQTKKTERGGQRTSGSRQMYAVTCGQCGQKTEVPFQPRGDRPVYCSDCFNKVRNR